MEPTNTEKHESLMITVSEESRTLLVLDDTSVQYSVVTLRCLQHLLVSALPTSADLPHTSAHMTSSQFKLVTDSRWSLQNNVVCVLLSQSETRELCQFIICSKAVSCLEGINVLTVVAAWLTGLTQYVMRLIPSVALPSHNKLQGAVISHQTNEP